MKKNTSETWKELLLLQLSFVTMNFENDQSLYEF